MRIPQSRNDLLNLATACIRQARATATEAEADKLIRRADYIRQAMVFTAPVWCPRRRHRLCKPVQPFTVLDINLQ